MLTVFASSGSGGKAGVYTRGHLLSVWFHMFTGKASCNSGHPAMMHQIINQDYLGMGVAWLQTNPSNWN